jgi:hypothetical protein
MATSSRAAAVVTVIALVAVAARVSAFGRPQTSLAALADRVDLPSLGTTVTMDDLSGRPVVSVWINGRGPFPFIVGTAAPVTAITEDLANELGLAPDSDQLASGPFLAEEVRVGEAVAHSVFLGRTIVVAGEGDAPVRGVLSPTSFPGVLFVLDYPAGRLRLLAGALLPPDGHHIFEYPVDEAAPTVSVDVAGHAFEVQVDSNAPGGLTLPTRDAADLPLADQPIEIGRVVDALGEFPVLVATLNGIVGIGDSPLEIHSIIFSDARPVSGAGRGRIGSRILEGFVLTLDVRNHRLSFDRPGGGD